ncbi:MAG: diphthine--ammonia ligase [Dehalococcoidales bacterium]|nr:diphthine--ammonia ligase [Dehalococcoidales bacterium]
MPRVFASWSGGKDCCLALHRAVAGGLAVSYLANTVSDDGQRSRSHGISAAVIRKQAEALGIPIVQQRTEGDNYEAQFIRMLKTFRQEGIDGGVFGDIDFEPHRDWIERVCAEADITPHLPLWGEDQKKLMEEFIDAGFIAVVIAAKAELFGEEVLGQKIDRDFIKQLDELSKTRDITPCGEAGEYHTLVIDGPLFKKRLEITQSRKVEREGIRFLDILSLELKSITRSTV